MKGVMDWNEEWADKVVYKRRVVTSWGISIFWVLLSTSLAILTSYSFLQPDWVVKRSIVIKYYSSNVNLFDTERKLSDHIENVLSDGGVRIYDYNEYNFGPSQRTTSLVRVSEFETIIRFGAIGICSNVDESGDKCQLYKESDAYSSLWTIVTILGGSGCVTLCVSAVLSFLAIVLPSSDMRHVVANIIALSQMIAVILLFAAELIFPLGFGSQFTTSTCGSLAEPYNFAECDIGWAFALLLVSTGLSVYCPVLAQFTANITYSPLPKYL